MEATVPLVIASVALLALALGAIADDRRARFRRRIAATRIELPLLHSINDDRCIGCEACVDVCPTRVLDIVDHKVKVARFSDCVQCEQCANACPTTALVMYRQGETPRTLTVPELDDRFQTSIPGQYLIGEVAGKPLVKNAANLGRAVIEYISRDAGPRPAGLADDVVDVAIVGSGPGGLSAGLTCLKNHMSCVVLEKEHIISSTVSRYPKGKHFMAEPSHVQNISYLPVFDASKEDLVAAWKRLVDGAKLPIRLGEAVEKVVRGEDGIFSIKTTVATYRARTVVLATGLRGKPRLLAVPGANLEKVQSLLDDPAEFAGEDVLVVGGGDSAVEGAMSLADAGARVTLSYRGDGFKRCKQGNQKRLAEMSNDGRLAVILESNVTEFTPDQVSLKCKDGSVKTLRNQRAFVLIGADTPVAWLEANNVRFVERPHLYQLGSTEDVVRRVAPEASECPKSPEDALAVVLGKPARAGQRLRSVVGHLQDEFRDVVTSVTGVFRLDDEQIRRLRQTPVKGVRSMPRPPVRRPAPPPVRRPMPGQVAGSSAARSKSPTDFPIERTTLDGAPLREIVRPAPRRAAVAAAPRVAPPGVRSAPPRREVPPAARVGAKTEPSRALPFDNATTSTAVPVFDDATNVDGTNLEATNIDIAKIDAAPVAPAPRARTLPRGTPSPASTAGLATAVPPRKRRTAPPPIPASARAPRTDVFPPPPGRYRA